VIFLSFVFKATGKALLFIGLLLDSDFSDKKVGKIEKRSPLSWKRKSVQAGERSVDGEYDMGLLMGH
jgi:hypothetical protein